MAMALPVSVFVAMILAAWFLKELVQKCIAVRSVSPLLKVCPGESVLWLHPFRTAATALGPFFPPKGCLGNVFEDFSLYAKHGSTCLSSVTFWDAVPVFWFSDADAIRTIQTSRRTFPKEVEAYEPLNIYGPNLITAEGPDWKRHRSVANSAFNEANNALVWRETFRVVDDWFNEIDQRMGSKTELLVDLINDLIHVTLLVISWAGFGRHASWKDDTSTEPPPGHKRTFRNAITSTLKYMLTRVLIPNWVHRLSSVVSVPFASRHLEETRESFESLRMHMLEMISSARDWIARGKTTTMDAALLRNLVEANMAHDAHHRYLSDEELLSDTFAFLLAGHETSAHTLSFTISLLALHPDIQKRAYEETCRLWSDNAPHPNCPSNKGAMAQLEYLSAIFYETLRLFPPVTRMAKSITTDTTLKARQFSAGSDGKISHVEEYDVLVRPGGLVVIDILGLHMNPIHWGSDVTEFKPERFIDTDTYRWPRDAFQAFSGGARSCIGQRFSLTESVCILARLIHKYEICVPENLKDQSFAEQKEFMLKWRPWVTITPLNAKVVLRVRK